MRVSSRSLTALLAAALLLASGCGSRDYELNVRLPAGTVVHRDAKVFLDGVEAGKVARVGRTDGKVLATLVLTERKLTEGRIKPGLVATVRGDRGIDLDTSEIDRRARPLPSGSTIEGTTKFALLIRRYTRWQTAVVFFLGALGLLIVFWVFRAFFKIGWVVVALALSAGAASVVHRPATALVEQVYTGDEGHDAPAAETPGDGNGGESILDIPRPSPRAVAFFAAWLAAFVVFQVLVGAALRATRKKT